MYKYKLLSESLFRYNKADDNNNYDHNHLYPSVCAGEVGDFEQQMCGEGYIQELAILPTIVSGGD